MLQIMREPILQTLYCHMCMTCMYIMLFFFNYFSCPPNAVYDVPLPFRDASQVSLFEYIHA